MLKPTMIFFVMLTLLSCDPGYVVLISNRSNKEKSIKVIVSHANKVRSRDSIAIITHQKRVNFPVTKNEVEPSYFFLLGKGKEAIIDQGIGGPDFRERIVVDNEDTIALRNSRRVMIKRRWMSTSVEITID